jgi:hypothetical protein
MKVLTSAFSLQPLAFANWLPDMDLNHDKQIQSLLCYRYTIGQAGACDRLKGFVSQSRLVKPLNRYIVEPCFAPSGADSTIQRFNDSTVQPN